MNSSTGFLLYVLLFFFNLMDLELTHDILYRRAAHDNRRAAGAVYISAFIIHYIQTKHIGVCRPGGEALIVFSVYSVYSVDFYLSCPFVLFVVSKLLIVNC